ncbi:MAG: twin-arginine translocase subunit TatC [Acidimicrobiales bacterium]|jgi:sec-independent protein translocase protein TatC
MAAPARLARLRDRRENPKPHPDQMTLGEHLGELRRRLVISICAIAVGAVVTYVFYDQILSFLQAPYCQAVTHTKQQGKCAFYVTQPLQGFALRLNVSAYGGILIALPVLFFQLWRFVTPGLKANEKRYALPFTFATAGLFALGAFVAYLTFPHAMRFLLDVSGPNKTIVAILSPNSYVQLILLLMVAFGVTFEFPVLLVALELAGVLTPAKLSKWRRWAIIGMVVFAGVVTPSSDPFSMLALALPLLLFYEASIIIGKMLGK